MSKLFRKLLAFLAHRWHGLGVAGLVLVGCATLCERPANIHRPEYAASYQLLVECSNGAGQMGSAVALGPHQVLTVKHVVDCNDDTTGEEFDVVGVLVGHSGPELAGHVGRVSESVDAATVVTDGTLAPPYARVTAVPPMQGDVLCVITGKFIKKCGYVVDLDDTSVVVAVRGVHGNSGSPVYNEGGEVVGVLSRASMDYEVDDVTRVVLVRSFLDILGAPVLL